MKAMAGQNRKFGKHIIVDLPKRDYAVLGGSLCVSRCNRHSATEHPATDMRAVR